jgi:TrmH family RNA methyltransferase
VAKLEASPEPERITSAANPAIALVRALSRRDRRAEERAFIVEGQRAVADAVQTGATPRLVLIREGSERLAPDLALPPGTRVRIVESRLFDRLSDVQTPQGLLSVFPMPVLDLESRPHAAPPLILIVDRLRDPGNLGTLLRAAAGAGAGAVYLTPESVDPWNAKVVRAGMGAHFRVPIHAFDAAASEDLAKRLPLRVAATAEAPVSYDAIDWTGPAAVVIGGEAEGVGEALAGWSTRAASIPLAAGVESLNAAMAGSIMLFEAARQRRNADVGKATREPFAGG